MDVVREERLDFSLCPAWVPAGAPWFRLTRAGSQERNKQLVRQVVCVTWENPVRSPLEGADSRVVSAEGRP